MYNNKTYAIINASDVSNVDFNQILQTSVNTLKYSIDGSLILIKWITPPAFIYVDELVDPVGIYTHQQILSILKTDAWYSEE
tara:strand:- start:300 stop:545 length:246 start_codon:yes stop_codon:yes gene_type:complete